MSDVIVWVSDDEGCAHEGIATPPHSEIALDTRIADALETLHADVMWDDRRKAWTVFYATEDGYPVYDYGASGEARRDVLVRWLLNERSIK